MKALALYQIADQFIADAEKLAALDLPPEALSDTLEGMTGDFEEKVINIIRLTRNLEHAAAGIKMAEASMERRRKALEAKVEGLREYVFVNMVKTNITRVSRDDIEIKLAKKAPYAVIDDAAKIPEAYLRKPEPVEPAPDKKAILDALKAGTAVEGCRLINDAKRLAID